MLLFGINIRYLREIDGHKLAEMPSITGFPRSTWAGYETGDSFPGFKDLIKISEYFGILESDLLHTEVAESDLHQLYYSFLQTRKDIKKEGDNPRSKSFLTYLSTDFEPITLPLKGSSVTESVTKPVTNTQKPARKTFNYTTADQVANGMILNEPEVPYGKAQKKSPEARIAHLEGFLASVKELFTTFEP
jgi:transcriptional regulator with XRE-family HTH domain